MSNTLTKERTLIEYIPATEDQPGSPGSPATPERVTWQTVDVRIEASASAMRETSEGVWVTPLDDLRATLGEPGVSATQAHYSETWGSVTTTSGSRTKRVPLSWTSAWVTRTRRVKVVEPARPAVPPTPPVKGSPARSVYDLHLGWNAGAHSVTTLPQNWVGTATFEVGKVVGAVVGFTSSTAVSTGVRYSFSNIRYGLVIADGKVQVREAGVTTKTVALASGADSFEAKIDGSRIEWRKNGVLIHKGPFAMPGTYVLDAALFAGGDAVNNPTLTDGTGDPNGGTLLLAAPRIRVAGDGQGAHLRMRPLALLASENNVAQAALSLGALRTSTDAAPSAALRIKPLRVSAAEQGNNGFGVLRLADISASASVEGGDGTYTPSYSICTMGLLPLVSGGGILGGGVVDGSLALRPLRAIVSDKAYISGALTMAPAKIYADVEELTPLVRAQELLSAPATAVSTMYVAIAISESIGASGAPSIAAVTVTAQALEQISAGATGDLTAHIVAAAIEQLGAGEKHQALLFRIVDGHPVLVEQGDAWAVNAETSASTRYENYSFSGFMSVAGKHFGVRADGVYLLEGQDDAGEPIESGVALGKHDFGIAQQKHIEAVYAGVSSTGKLMVRIGDGKSQYTYAARAVDESMRTQRFDPGRGLKANYFTFDLLSDEGSFELDSIDFQLVLTNRRI